MGCVCCTLHAVYVFGSGCVSSLFGSIHSIAHSSICVLEMDFKCSPCLVPCIHAPPVLYVVVEDARLLQEGDLFGYHHLIWNDMVARTVKVSPLF